MCMYAGILCLYYMTHMISHLSNIILKKAQYLLKCKCIIYSDYCFYVVQYFMISLMVFF